MYKRRSRNLVRKQGVHEVYYTRSTSRVPDAHDWLVMHHGICHTRRYFVFFIYVLRKLGFNVAMVEQFVDGPWISRNLVGMDRYRDGMKAAVEKIKADITKLDPSARIVGYVCHSMGGMICEEMQHANPEHRRPTIYITRRFRSTARFLCRGASFAGISGSTSRRCGR
jgi:alpha-beta hydrolase superfamily lysophospholipase